MRLRALRYSGSLSLVVILLSACSNGAGSRLDTTLIPATTVIETTTTTAPTTTTTAPTTTTVPPIEWPQPPETWMILATQDYLADWTEALAEMRYEEDYLEVGDLTAMGRFWLERDYHPSLGCTEDQIRTILGSSYSGFDLPIEQPQTTMVADVKSMQVIGYDPGLGFLLTYNRDIVRRYDDGHESTSGPNVSYVYVDPDLGMAFGAWTSCS